MVQRYANAAPAEEWVVFRYGEIWQCLVAAHVEGAHGHGPGLERFHVLPVEFPLLFLGGEPVMGDERHFRSEQADPFRTAVERSGNVARQADVHPQEDPPSVEGNARKFF